MRAPLATAGFDGVQILANYLYLLAQFLNRTTNRHTNEGVRSKTEPAFCSKSSKRCSTRSIRECYQMVVVGQNVLTGLPFRARVGSISRTAARE
jgi:hypothetical protein